jgi:hypothetical protein
LGRGDKGWRDGWGKKKSENTVKRKGRRSNFKTRNSMYLIHFEAFLSVYCVSMLD